MSKLLFGIIAVLSSIGAVKWGNGTIFWIGVGILSFIGLVLFILTTWGLVKLFKGTITMAVYDILTVLTICTLTFRGVISLNWCFATTIPLTAMFSLIVMRVIAYHAQTSVIWSEIFSWLTGYKIKSIIKVDVKSKTSKVVKVEEIIEDKQERDDIIAALTALQFSVEESKKAADYAIKNEPSVEHAEKVRCALNYLESNRILTKV